MTSTHTFRSGQSHGSQMVDAVFLLALLFVTLFLTTYVFADDGASGAAETQVVPISELPISAGEKRQFTKMQEQGMVDAQTVAAAVGANAPQEGKYTFSGLALLGTVALAVLYLGFVYLMSFREYREVVRARFGPRERSSS
jgi:hypothetical protein